MTTELRQDLFRIEENGDTFRWNETTQSWDATTQIATNARAAKIEEALLFVELDADNTVISQTTIDRRYAQTDTGTLDESVGVSYIQELFSVTTNWVMLTPERITPSIGWKYYPDRGVFIGPSPSPSWVLDDNNVWAPPLPMPDDGQQYYWDEDLQSWELIPADAPPLLV
jgi:hypothetical protein